jgi:hypothetical protein
VGGDRAETYLRLLTEVQLRQAGDQLRGLDVAAGPDDSSDPGRSPGLIWEIALQRVERAGRILIAAGEFDEDSLWRLTNDLNPAIQARSRILMSGARRRGMFLPRPDEPPPSGHGGRVTGVTPIGRSLWVASDPAPAALHFLSLVRTETEAVITVVMRLDWSPDEPSTDQEIVRVGPPQLPYDQLWAVDDAGTRYTFRFESGTGTMATWRGVARLSPMPPLATRRLDLIADGTLLIQIPLRPAAARGTATESVPVRPGERLLVLAAEHILASADAGVLRRAPVPGEIIAVLTEAGAITADSPGPGQLAALCQRLGAAGHGITVPPAAQLPARWASVLAQLEAPASADGPEALAPLACMLPNVDGAWFALAGLSMARGESHLHVVSSGMPQLMNRFAPNWKPGFSWWLRDGSGNWHVAMATAPYRLSHDGMQAFQLRLTPPLAAVPDAVEVEVTGPATRARATVPIRPTSDPAPGRGGPSC